MKNTHDQSQIFGLGYFGIHFKCTKNTFQSCKPHFSALKVTHKDVYVSIWKVNKLSQSLPNIDSFSLALTQSSHSLKSLSSLLHKVKFENSCRNQQEKLGFFPMLKTKNLPQNCQCTLRNMAGNSKACPAQFVVAHLHSNSQREREVEALQSKLMRHVLFLY